MNIINLFKGIINISNIKPKEEKNEVDDMTKIYKLGRCWYTIKKEAEDAQREDERIMYNPELKAYYLIRQRSRMFRRR